MGVRYVTASELGKSNAKERVALVDVRTAAEFDEVHAVGAAFVPLSRFDPYALAGRPEFTGKEICLICESGFRARQAADKCVAAGLPDVLVVDGGMAAWRKARLPVEGLRAADRPLNWSPFAAAALMLLGLALAALLHPAFALLGLVGGGWLYTSIVGSPPSSKRPTPARNG